MVQCVHAREDAAGTQSRRMTSSLVHFFVARCGLVLSPGRMSPSPEPTVKEESSIKSGRGHEGGGATKGFRGSSVVEDQGTTSTGREARSV